MSQAASSFKPLAPKDLSRTGLLAAIQASSAPKELVAALPAQTVYFCLQSHGLEAAFELLELMTDEQRTFALDLDLWTEDEFNEENFWHWLEANDQDDDFTLLKKFLRSLDLKLLGIIIDKYVSVVFLEEASETPPRPGLFTPDKGFTWIGINIENGERFHLLGKLLAYIFESNADLFYKILAVPNIETKTSLTEQSFQEKVRRLKSQGIPERQESFEILTPLRWYDIKDKLSNANIINHQKFGSDLAPVHALILWQKGPQPLLDLFNEKLNNSEFVSEYTFLINTAVVRFGIQLNEKDKLSLLISQVNGALNLALQEIHSRTQFDALRCWELLGLVDLFRFGLGSIITTCKEQTKKFAHQKEDGSVPAFILDCLKRPFPVMPKFFLNDQNHDAEPAKSISTEVTAIETLDHLELIKKS